MKIFRNFARRYPDDVTIKCRVAMKESTISCKYRRIYYPDVEISPSTGDERIPILRLNFSSNLEYLYSLGRDIILFE